MTESEIPARVAESPVKTDQSGVISLIAPGILSVLLFYLFELAGVQGLPKLTHEAKIQVGVVLVRGLVNEVEIPEDQPPGRARCCDRSQLADESDLLRVALRPIDTRSSPRGSILPSCNGG